MQRVVCVWESVGGTWKCGIRVAVPGSPRWPDGKNGDLLPSNQHQVVTACGMHTGSSKQFLKHWQLWQVCFRQLITNAPGRNIIAQPAVHISP
jgi:hypothetical protein